MTDIQRIYAELRRAGITETGALALMGNWKCESLLDPYRKQGDLSEAALPSHRYVDQITAGQISMQEFISDQIGFGLAQWTFWSPSKQQGRKLDLYNFWKSSGLPLDSAAMQTRFAVWELTHQGQYAKLWNYLCTVGTDGLYNAVDRVCREYEQPTYNNVQNRYDAAVQLAAKLDLNDTSTPAGSGKPENVSGPDIPASSGGPSSPRSTLKQGMRGDDVRDLQNLLLDAGYSVGRAGADGIYGSDTFRAVAAFQEDHGLPVTGSVNQKTLDAIKAAWKGIEQPPDDPPPEDDTEHQLILSELSYGSRGDQAALLQTALNLCGFPCGKADGEIGPKTQAALNAFKEYKGLKPDGKADKDTWTLLLMWRWE